MERQEQATPPTTTPTAHNAYWLRFMRFCRQQRRFLIYPLALLLYLLASAQGQAQSGAYWLTWVSFGSGGQSSNGGYTLQQVVGAPVAGTQQGGGYTLVLGLVNPATSGTPIITPLTPTLAVTPVTPTPPTPEPTVSVTPPASTGDGYEIDDSCTQARTIPTDGATQVHTFHQGTDEDWVMFSAVAGVRYRMTVRVPPPSDVDVIFDLYDECSGSATLTQDPSFSPEIRYTFNAPRDGLFYLHLRNKRLAAAGANGRYEVAVRALDAEAKYGALIIVAGRLKFNDELQTNIHQVTDRIYRLWRSRGYPADRIYYLAVDQTRDPSGDGDADVDGLPTVPHLRQAITTWAADKVGPNQPLTIYLVDHGEEDQFFLDSPNNQILRPEALDEWLDQLTAPRPDTPINIIIEACKSGSFIIAPHSISGGNRVVLTATEAYALAYGSPETGGIIFSDALLDALAQGHTLYNAFLDARTSARSRNADQVPWIDDNGNGLPNQPDDGALAARRNFVLAPLPGDSEPWAPYVAAAEVRSAAGKRREIWAQVLDDNKVKAVWAALYPPSYVPPTTGAELVLGVLPTALQARGGDWFGVDYGELQEIGEYRIVIYAEDELGLQSRPREIRVNNGSRVWLPLVVR